MKTLAIDLGGTNCRIGQGQDTHLLKNTLISLRNDDFDSFADLLATALQIQSCAPQNVVIALAAPINGDIAELTNLDWVLDKAQISRISGAREVHYINDFEALGHAIGSFNDLDTQLIMPGLENRECDLRLVLGAGTGFNCAALTAQGEVIRCESGHATWCAETDLDLQLQAHFGNTHGRCSIERLLSGNGLVAINHVLCQNSGVAIKHKSSTEIVMAALAGQDDIALQSSREFARILGRTAGDLALTFLAYGGVYLNGGITRALTPILCEAGGPFAEAFSDKGRMVEQMMRFSVHVLEDDCTALVGCLRWLAQQCNQTTLPAPYLNTRRMN